MTSNVNGHLEYTARHFDEAADNAVTEHGQFFRAQAREIRQMIQNNERLVRDLRSIINSSNNLDQHERGTLCEAIRALGGNP